MLNDVYSELLVTVNHGNQVIMLTYLHLDTDRNGSISEKVLLTKEEIEAKSALLQEDLYANIALSLDTGRHQILPLAQNKAVIIEPFMPKPRLIVFGGGHIAKPLVEFAARVGFAVTVIDDRPTFANRIRFPEAEEVICESFEKCFNSISFREPDYVVVITRGHRHDGVVLREVLRYDLSYVGMIGSKRRVKGMMEELVGEGFSKEKLDAVNAPIGLNIGAVTPDEIAISIVAQLISFKNKGTQNKTGEKFTFPEFDREVVENAAEESQMPRVLITILSSKGSVPRKAGAKMVAYLDGRTVGSIGGGCSEAAVITKARELMLKKGFFIEAVDMTGDVAESEGMVCGGIMEVLVEAF